ncbi:MAG TPA: RNA polymerase sigma factor [Usitatibacter sp.]|nr:RNA polymerase sigma factor [Usitatibacter sp.]
MAQAAGWMTAEDEERISAQIARESPRLRSFVRRRVADAADAEDILQDVFFELVESYRLPRPVEEVGAWLFRVARNRIADFFRKKRPVAFTDLASSAGDDDLADIVELLPSADAGPEAAYARGLLLEELDAALAELPREQREVFIAHEIEGRSFKDLAAGSGESINTLLSRKRYAVLHLRERLADIYDEFIDRGE